MFIAIINIFPFFYSYVTTNTSLKNNFKFFNTEIKTKSNLFQVLYRRCDQYFQRLLEDTQSMIPSKIVFFIIFLLYTMQLKLIHDFLTSF